MSEIPEPAERYGFPRTKCNCPFCRAPCHHLPGSLDVADLERLCPAGCDLFAWAEEHLRALIDKSYPTLVPARGPDGACHWLFQGQCTVHAHSPYGCAYFDAHQSDAEAQRRADATIQARREDEASQGLYFQIWKHLCRKGLIGPPGDRAGLAKEVALLRRNAESAGRFW